VRLGIYIDDVYWIFPQDGGSRVSSDRSFSLFLCEVGDAFGALAIFGRTVHASEPADYVLPARVDLIELPHYANLRRVGDVVRGSLDTARAFSRGLGRVDVVWLFGPHPFAVVFVALAALRRKKVVLGVRQDSVRVYAARLPGLRWLPARLLVHALQGTYRLLARRLPTTVQGAELAEKYGADGRAPVLPMTESIVRAADVVAAPPERDWGGQLELLTVGRLEPEKNPQLLIDALAGLEREAPGRYRLTWVGRGPLEDEIRQLVSDRGLDDRVEFIGYVAFDGGLLDLYRRAHLFVHVSLSEGMPKVLIEALACGTPVVATDVGGVRAALDDGAAGALVPPDDLDALTAAIRRMSDDAELRDGYVRRGLELARGMTLEAQAARVREFIWSHSSA
jgi:glycosyltransferase involved in cell wall biosynthesis